MLSAKEAPYGGASPMLLVDAEDAEAVAAAVAAASEGVASFTSIRAYTVTFNPASCYLFERKEEA